MNGNLVIGYKKDPINRFNVGDTINVVNGTEVSKENMCEFQELLNANNNWGKFKIETIIRE